MKPKRIFFLIIFIFSIFSLNAAPFDMILTGDPIIEDIRFLSLKTGRTFLSFTPPLSPHEVRNFLDRIDENALCAPALEAYDRISRRLTPAARISLNLENFALFLDFNAALDGRLNLNTDNSWDRHFPRNPAMASAPLRIFFFDSLQLYMEPAAAMYRDARNRGTFTTNIPTDDAYRHFDQDTPVRTFLAAGGPWWNFQFGRDRLFWGIGHTGSLTFNDNLSFNDYARLSFFLPFFKYSILVSQMPLNIGGLRSPYYSWDGHLTNTMNRHLYIHRLEFSIFNRVTLALTEGVMVGNAPLELRFLNPFNILHSLYSWLDYGKFLPVYDVNREFDPSSPLGGDMNGSMFSFEINWHIVRSLSVYWQFLMHEFALRGELNQHPNQPPDKFGYMAGIQFSHSFNNWASVSFLEFIYTAPYQYIVNSPFASFIHRTRRSQIHFIGFPRDTMSLTLGTRFFNNENNLNFSGRFSWVSRGERDIDGIVWDWKITPEKRAERTPTGIVNNLFILSLGSQWQINRFFSLNGNVTGIVSLNHNHVKNEFKTGAQLGLSISFRY